jgi:hypothetical protein
MRRTVTTLSLAAVTLTGCFTSTADFRRDAETFIVENQGLANAVETTFASAECEEPRSQDVGTTFPCSALDEDGRTWTLDIEITGSNEYEVNVARFPTSSD